MQRLSLSYPFFGWAALILALALIWICLSRRYHHSVIYYLSAMILVALALSRPKTMPQQYAPLTLVFCLDSSASLSQSERDSILQQAAALTESLPPRTRLVFLTFGDNTRRCPRLPETLAPQYASDLPDALRTALAIIEKNGGCGRVALFSDGGSAAIAPQLRQLTRQYRRVGIELFVHFPEPRRREWRLHRIQVPELMRPNVRLPITIYYSSNFSGILRLTVLANAKPYLQEELQVATGNNGILRLEGPPLAAGDVYLQLHADGDSRAENNGGYAFTQVTPFTPVLLLTAAKTELPLVKALRLQQVPVQVNNWESLPMPLDFPLVIIDTATPQHLEQHLAILQNYLQRGGSILVVDAQQLQAPWAPLVSQPFPGSQKPKPPPKLKPPEPPPAAGNREITADVELRSAAIVLVIDRSESMTGEKLALAKQAALASISRLWVQDLAGVVMFDTLAQWVVPLGRSDDFQRVAQRIISIAPGGGTAIKPALQKAYQALKAVPAHIKHIILLSDGQDENGIFARSELQPLVEEIHQEKISITTIGVGNDFDPVLMPLLAKWGNGKFYFAANYQQIPVMMLSDVDRILGIKRARQSPPTKPKPATELPLPQASDKALAPNYFSKTPQVKVPQLYPVQPATNATLFEDFAAMPPLPRYQRCRLRPGGQLELTVGADPLLAHWRWHRGQVMVFAAGQEHWSDWHYYPVFWSRLARFLAPEKFAGPNITLTRLPALADLVPMRLTVSNTDGTELAGVKVSGNFPFWQQTPKTWLGEIPLAAPGQWQTVAIEVFQGKRLLGKTKTAFAQGYPAEVGDLEVRNRLLTNLAETTGGGRLPQQSSRLLAPRVTPSPRFWHEPLLLLALVFGLLWLSIIP